MRFPVMMLSSLALFGCGCVVFTEQVTERKGMKGLRVTMRWVVVAF
jgi:hypothetical protein